MICSILGPWGPLELPSVRTQIGKGSLDDLQNLGSLTTGLSDDLQYLGALGSLEAAQCRDRYGKAPLMIYSIWAA